MEDFVYTTLLLDFYGELLTDKQKTFMGLYYFENWSLQEIAEDHAITPQGVRDLLMRTVKLLKRYEKALGLIARQEAQKSRLAQMTQYIGDMHAPEEEKQTLLQWIANIENDI